MLSLAQNDPLIGGQGGGTAVLVGVQLPGVAQAEVDGSLDELGRLVKTLGLTVVRRLTQARPNTGAPTVLGSGKLEELTELTNPKAPDGDEDDRDDEDDEDDERAETPAPALASVVVFDQELTPTQLRNLQAATGAEVMDRSAVILGIFQRHARTREAKLQVEIARLIYLAPRLRAVGGGGGERQRGGIGGKGAGESVLELGRRAVRDRISELRTELARVQKESDTRRARRDQRATVALVGYTNAGKSSLMRGLTDSAVLVRDQLFATLDTTVRLLQPPTTPQVFVSDTVGFIKKLPHDLVASFRSTLQEAREASILLYVVDASDPAWESQLAVTREVIAEVGAGELPGQLVLNKADRLDPATLSHLAEEHPDALLLSAKRPEDVAALRAHIIELFERDMVDEELFVSYAQGRFVHTIHETGRVLSERHDEQGTHLVVRAPQQAIDELKARLAQTAPPAPAAPAAPAAPTP